MKRIITLWLLVWTVFPLMAQPLNEEQRAFLDSVQQQYVQAHSLWMEIEMRTFDEEDRLIGEVNTYRTFKSGEHYLVETPYATQLLTEDFQLIVNHKAQFMMLMSVENPTQPEAIMQIDPPFSEGAWPVGELSWEETEDKVSLRVVPPGEGSQVSTYHFDRERYLLSGVDYRNPTFLRGQPAQIRIHYPVVKVNQGVGDATLELKAYLEEQDGEWLPTQEWATYEFINETKS